MTLQVLCQRADDERTMRRAPHLADNMLRTLLPMHLLALCVRVAVKQAGEQTL